MLFERCRDSIIEDFITDCEECNLLTRQENRRKQRRDIRTFRRA